MTFLGLSIYDGWFWGTDHAWAADQVFALDLHYRRRIEGAKLAERSVEEIALLGLGTPEQRLRWGEAMRRTFPSVEAGDRITGLNAPAGFVRFFHNDQPIGEIADPQFARAFFAIWLDPRTSRPEFRRKLLGG